MILYLLGGVISFVTAFFWKPLILEFLTSHNIKNKNYNKNLIPVGMGVLLLLCTIVSSFFLLFITDQPMMYYIYLFGLSLIGFAGVIDDLVGENRIKGLKGHLMKMYKGELTSGGLKAIIGGLTALYVSFSFSLDVLDLLINTLLIVLYTNTMNLFDVRPGRAAKTFSIMSVLFWVSSKSPDRFLTFLMMGGILIILKGDLKEEYMLGDVGSNILGYTLGFTSAISLNIYLKMVLVILLIILHAVAEVTSFTVLINKNPLLKYIDGLGRVKELSINKKLR